MGKYFIVYSKSDDYGHCKTELVETTLKLAKEYYHYKEIPPEDYAILAKYISIVSKDEESQRTSEERFYGTES